MSSPQYIVMGVSGCGKSSVARMLAAAMEGVYLDADDFHPPANKAKMAAGTPLVDEDRWPWLDTLNAELRWHANTNRILFLACSALKQAYRDRLSTGVASGVKFIYLKGSKELVRSRMHARQDHFMPAKLLDSQFATLEEPTDAIVIDINDPLRTCVDKAIAILCPA